MGRAIDVAEDTREGRQEDGGVIPAEGYVKRSCNYKRKYQNETLKFVSVNAIVVHRGFDTLLKELMPAGDPRR